MTALSGIDPASSLRADYCHKVVRHVVLWAKGKVDGSKINVEGQLIVVEPGCCSNLEPPKAIADRNLGHLDLVWYLLAEAEIASGKSVGIADQLYNSLSDGVIPSIELSLRLTRLKRHIKDLNASDIVSSVWPHVEASSYFLQEKDQIKKLFDVFKPLRGNIPPVPRSMISVPEIAAFANEGLIAFVIAAVCRSTTQVLSKLEKNLETEFGGGFPACKLLRRANSKVKEVAASNFDDALMDSVNCYRVESHPSPSDHAVTAIRFFQWANQSNFKNVLVPLIAAWQRAEWNSVVQTERFRLWQPNQTVLPLILALTITKDGSRFLTTLFLALVTALKVNVPETVRTEFENLAKLSDD